MVDTWVVHGATEAVCFVVFLLQPKLYGNDTSAFCAATKAVYFVILWIHRQICTKVYFKLLMVLFVQISNV